MGGPRNPRWAEENPSVSMIRPYLLTYGRAEPVDASLAIEAQVLTSRLGVSAMGELAFELRDIVELCHESRSVAEVASVLGLHIGVARVLVGDLAQYGYVVVRQPNPQPSQDIDIIERVIRGLERIH
jgi:hypothetical protein